jgi:hypothetical protein
MGPNETTGELLARITNTMVVIKESYAAYDNKVHQPPTDAHGLGQVGLLEATATQWKSDMVNNMLQFYKMQLLRASLPGDLRKAMAQHDQNMIMLDDMYQGQAQRSNRYNSGNSGNNRNRNGKYCFYCKIKNHTQEECWKRIKDNKLCKDKQVHAYWPKVYVTNEQQERDQQGQQPVFQ